MLLRRKRQRTKRNREARCPIRLAPFLDLSGLSNNPVRSARSLSHSADISERVKRAEEIEQKLIEGQTVVELDPSVVDDSSVPDRMEATQEQNAAFREMIREHGQSVPILVRPKPEQPGRFEVAFGHRRLRAARELGIKVRAVVKNLTDVELVVAQGQENSGRTDLTFIERARFAARLEEPEILARNHHGRTQRRQGRTLASHRHRYSCAAQPYRGHRASPGIRSRALARADGASGRRVRTACALNRSSWCPRLQNSTPTSDSKRSTMVYEVRETRARSETWSRGGRNTRRARHAVWQKDDADL